MASIIGGYFQMQMTWEDLISMGNITPLTQTHLKKVYLSLCLILLSLAVGFNVQFFIKIGGLCTVVVSLGSFTCFFFIHPDWERIRVSLLMAAEFFKGASIGYLMDFFIPIDQGFIITALVEIALIFGSFFVTTITEGERFMIYFTGALCSLLATLTWYIVAYKCFRGIGELLDFPGFLIWQLVYPLGYLWFLVYLITYSQEMIVQFRGGNFNIWQHVVTFFTHMPAVHVYTIFIVLREAYRFVRPRPQPQLQPQPQLLPHHIRLVAPAA